MKYVDLTGMKVRVTKLFFARAFTNGLVIKDTIGTVQEYDQDIAGRSPIIDNHYIRGDILVYFEHLDYCYWLADGEYEPVKTA